MSIVVAVKYLAEFAADALKPWDPSREKAAVMLADLPLMVRLREDDAATADEVTFLVLGRFDKAELPNKAGADFLAALRNDWENDFSNCPRCIRPRANSWTDHCDTCDGPLAEVVPQPTAEADREFCGYDTCTEYAGYGVGRCRAHHDLAVFP